MVSVMLMGGRKDGSILEVPGELEPTDRYLSFAVPIGPMKFEGSNPEGKIELERVKAFITPRVADSGPAWKVEIPREAWGG